MILKRLKTLVDEQVASPTTDTESSTLYRCPSCETTFIATEKAVCSNCDVAVDEVPSASELGIGPNDR